MSDDDKKTIKFQMMMSPAEAEALDDWGFRNRIRSRAEVIRRLCQVGLTSLELNAKLNTNMIQTSQRISGIFENINDPLSKGDIRKLIEEIFNCRIQINNQLAGIIAEVSSIDLIIHALSVGETIEESMRLSADLKAKIDSLDRNSDEYVDFIHDLLKKGGHELKKARPQRG